MAAKIKWGEPKRHGIQNRNRVDGYIGGLLVAWAVEGTFSEAGKWYVHCFLQPLPDNLDRMTDDPKASLESAKRTAQRIVNEYAKILNGEGPEHKAPEKATIQPVKRRRALGQGIPKDG